MKAILPISLLTLISAAALITGCITGGSGGLPPGPAGTGKVVGPYTVADGNIITPARVDTSYDCFSDSVHIYLDTMPAESLGYVVTGNSILFADPRLDTLASGVVYQLTIKADRSGSGTGLEGAWTYRAYKSQIVSGTPTAADLDTLANRDALTNKFLANETVQVQFANGMISVYVDVNSAQQFLDNWNGAYFDSSKYADSANYDIAVSAIDRHTVKLVGRKSGETVTVTIDSDDNRTFASSVAAHTEYHYVANSKTCQDPEPDWYYTFQSANAKPGILNGGNPLAPKMGATPEIRSKTGFRGFFRSFPLKAP